MRIDHVETSGTFALDGGEWDVDNNIWLVGDDSEVYIIDAAHDAGPIIDAVDGRTVKGIICTHGHNDHVTVAPQLSEQLDAPIYLHPGDQMLWEMTHSGTPEELRDQQTFEVAGAEMRVLNTPGHSPGSCCLYIPEANELFSGDTLFQGGPGATGDRSFASFDTIIESLKTSVLDLPAETVVRTGHGDHTTIGAEAPHLEEWIKRGY